MFICKYEDEILFLYAIKNTKRKTWQKKISSLPFYFLSEEKRNEIWFKFGIYK